MLNDIKEILKSCIVIMFVSAISGIGLTVGVLATTAIILR